MGETSAKRLTPGTKRAQILRAFLARGEAGLNCFQAALQHHDFVLRTTVSDLARGYGISFDKRHEKVPALGGTKSAECVRYSLTADGARKARALLGEPA